MAVRERVLTDVTLRLARDRYGAMSQLRKRTDAADWFRARMLGRAALVVRGEEGVRAFYDSELVTRRGAVPAPIRLLLFGPKAVHGLNGQAHRRRKQLFLRVIDNAAATGLASAVAERLDKAVATWPDRRTVRLFDELVDVYGAAALDWAGTGTRGDEALRVSRELAAIVDGFGLGGTTYPRAALARLRAHRWAMSVIREVRDGRRGAPEGSPVAMLAGMSRKELPTLVAATELLNIVRPTVAVAYFGAYAAQALRKHADWRPLMADGSPVHLRAFEHEIRRWYPFTPLLTGRLVRSYRWGDVTFRRRAWMVLDVIGTNRDPRLWDRPDDFAPERFLDREPTAFDYVPHGGGNPASGHRCPGEPLAVSILGVTLQRLAGLDYDLAEEAQRVPLDRIPSLPADGMTLVNVRTAVTA